MSKSFLLCLGGELGELGELANEDLAVHDVVVAVDSGFAHAKQLGLHPDFLIGDLDSTKSDAVQLARDGGTEVLQFSSHKDLTDFELALAFVTERGAAAVTVIAGWGGRLDHFVGNLAALAAPAHSHLQRQFRGQNEWACIVDDAAVVVHGQAGEIVSLLPFGGEVESVTTTGLKWPLSSTRLSPYAALGVSNELIAPSGTITASGGVLLVVTKHRAQYI